MIRRCFFCQQQQQKNRTAPRWTVNKTHRDTMWREFPAYVHKIFYKMFSSGSHGEKGTFRWKESLVLHQNISAGLPSRGRRVDSDAAPRSSRSAPSSESPDSWRPTPGGKVFGSSSFDRHASDNQKSADDAHARDERCCGYHGYWRTNSFLSLWGVIFFKLVFRVTNAASRVVVTTSTPEPPPPTNHGSRTPTLHKSSGLVSVTTTASLDGARSAAYSAAACAPPRSSGRCSALQTVPQRSDVSVGASSSPGRREEQRHFVNRGQNVTDTYHRKDFGDLLIQGGSIRN